MPVSGRAGDCGTRIPVNCASYGLLRHLLDDTAAGPFSQDELGATVWHDLALDQHVRLVVVGGFGVGAGLLLSPPHGQLDRLPALCPGRTVAGVDDGVHHVSVIERLARHGAVVDGVQHLREHRGIAQLADLVSNREQPAAVGFGLLGDVALLSRGRKHLEAGAQPVVEPDGTLRAGNLVAQVHAAAEAPTDLELADGAAVIANQPDRVVLRGDGMHLGIGPAHDLKRPDVLADEGAADLDAVAAEVDDGTATRLLDIPEPGAMGSGVRLARARPQDLAEGAGPYGLNGLLRFGGVDEVFQVAMKDAGLLHDLQHVAGFAGVTGQRLGTQDRLAGLRGQFDGLFVLVIRQADHHDVRLGIGNGRFQIGRPPAHAPILGASPGPLLRTRVQHLDVVGAAPGVQGLRVKHADQTGAKHGDPVHLSLHFACPNFIVEVTWLYGTGLAVGGVKGWRRSYSLVPRQAFPAAEGYISAAPGGAGCPVLSFPGQPVASDLRSRNPAKRSPRRYGYRSAKGNSRGANRWQESTCTARCASTSTRNGSDLCPGSASRAQRQAAQAARPRRFSSGPSTRVVERLPGVGVGTGRHQAAGEDDHPQGPVGSSG